MDMESGSFVIDQEGPEHARAVMSRVRAELQPHGGCVKTAVFLAVERTREPDEPNPIDVEAVAGHVDACDDCERLAIGARSLN